MGRQHWHPGWPGVGTRSGAQPCLTVRLGWDFTDNYIITYLGKFAIL